MKWVPSCIKYRKEKPQFDKQIILVVTNGFLIIFHFILNSVLFAYSRRSFHFALFYFLPPANKKNRKSTLIINELEEKSCTGELIRVKINCVGVKKHPKVLSKAVRLKLILNNLLVVQCRGSKISPQYLLVSI